MHFRCDLEKLQDRFSAERLEEIRKNPQEFLIKMGYLAMIPSLLEDFNKFAWTGVIGVLQAIVGDDPGDYTPPIVDLDSVKEVLSEQEEWNGIISEQLSKKVRLPSIQNQ
jgi:hypothetical protein